MSRPLVLCAGIVALVAVGAGCGDDDDSAGPVTTGDGPVLEVGAEDDLSFDSESYTVDAGEVQVVYRNEGVIAHTLLFDEIDDFKLSVGNTDTGTVTMEPGTYRMYCDLPGHEDAGMVAEVTVR